MKKHRERKLRAVEKLGEKAQRKRLKKRKFRKIEREREVKGRKVKRHKSKID